MIWIYHKTWMLIRESLQAEWRRAGFMGMDEYLNCTHDWNDVSYSDSKYGINLYFNDPVDELAFKLKYNTIYEKTCHN